MADTVPQARSSIYGGLTVRLKDSAGSSALYLRNAAGAYVMKVDSSGNVYYTNYANQAPSITPGFTFALTYPRSRNVGPCTKVILQTDTADNPILIVLNRADAGVFRVAQTGLIDFLAVIVSSDTTNILRSKTD